MCPKHTLMNNMKIGEARSAYYAQYKKFSSAAAEVNKQKEEAEKNSRLYPSLKDQYEKEAATLELSYEKLNEKSQEYLDFQSKVIEMETAYFNMLNSQYAAEDEAKAHEDELKCIETARRLMKGDRVPPQDEEKLMRYSFELYMSAKQMGILAKEHQEDDSLWDDEEKEEERMDPMEYATDQAAPAGGPSLDLEVSDVAPEVSIE